MMSCRNCIYSRLVYNSKHRDRFVGCIKFSRLGISDEDFIGLLEAHKYNSALKYVMSGWIYATLKPGDEPEKFNTASAHLLANEMLVTPSEAKCDLFKPLLFL